MVAVAVVVVIVMILTGKTQGRILFWILKTTRTGRLRQVKPQHLASCIGSAQIPFPSQLHGRRSRSPAGNGLLGQAESTGAGLSEERKNQVFIPCPVIRAPARALAPGSRGGRSRTGWVRDVDMAWAFMLGVPPLHGYIFSGCLLLIN